MTDAVTKSPVEGLSVCATAWPEDGSLGKCATTDSAGKYLIELNPHGYVVQFDGEPLGYALQWFDHADHWWERESLVVGSDPITGVDAEMKVLGRIEGVVREEGSGDPVENTRVCAWALGLATRDHCTNSDASGAYSMSDVQPGEYTVEFLPRSNHLWQYYDHADNSAESDPVSVALSEVVTGIDADLLPGAGLEGTMRLGGTDEPFHDAWVKIVPVAERGSSFWLAGKQGDGTYSVVGLPPGDYKVEFLPYFGIWQTQFWDHTESWEEATTLSLSAGTITPGIDADMVRVPLLPRSPRSQQQPVLTPSLPAIALAQSPPANQKRVPCPKGSRKKRVAGKVRCIRKHKRRHSRDRR